MRLRRDCTVSSEPHCLHILIIKQDDIFMVHTGSVAADSCLLLLPWYVSGGFVFGPYFVMQYLVSFLVLQSSC